MYSHPRPFTDDGRRVKQRRIVGWVGDEREKQIYRPRPKHQTAQTRRTPSELVLLAGSLVPHLCPADQRRSPRQSSALKSTRVHTSRRHSSTVHIPARPANCNVTTPNPGYQMRDKDEARQCQGARTPPLRMAAPAKHGLGIHGETGHGQNQPAQPALVGPRFRRATGELIGHGIHRRASTLADRTRGGRNELTLGLPDFLQKMAGSVRCAGSNKALSLLIGRPHDGCGYSGTPRHWSRGLGLVEKGRSDDLQRLVGVWPCSFFTRPVFLG
jgi:hypothetical protein